MLPIEEKSSRLPAIILTLILLLLAFRLTCTESLRETISQKAARLDTEVNPSPDNIVAPDVGAPYLAAYVTLALLLAGATAWSAGRVLGAMRIMQFALIVAIIALLVWSTLSAAARFPALLGTIDIATSLLCAWSIAVVCQDSLLGDRGRHAVIAAIVAVLTMGCAKAAMQHFIEYPDLVEYLKEHRDEALSRAGISPTDPYQVYLFMGRVNSMEVTGFGAMTNAFASQIIAFVGILSAAIIAAVVSSRQDRAKPVPVADSAKTPRPRAGGKVLDYHGGKPPVEIPVPLIAAVALGIFLLSGLLLIPLTHSNGGMGSLAITMFVFLVGVIFWKKFVRWRVALVLLAAGGAMGAAAVVIYYGISHNGLPSLSLLYRWQYWSGAAPMVREFPLTGVGLNNFGDYYLQYKSPAAPEDVKDPHSFFVRLLAEAGIPATVLITALLVWFLQSLWRKAAPPAQTDAEKHSLAPALALPGLAGVIWIPLHLLTEGGDNFTTTMTMIYAVVGWGAFAAVMVVLNEVTRGNRHPLCSVRFVTMSGVVASLGMLLYDQVNMALVTGGVATLFWVLLALHDSHMAAPAGKSSRPAAMTVAGICTVGGIAAAVLLFVPVVRSTFPWDPNPHEVAYLRAITLENNPGKALESLDRALALAPNSIELRMQRIALKRERLRQPVAEDIRRVLQLDRASARLRLDVALPDSDLPAAERIAILREARKLDDALPPKEAKRLTPEHQKKVDELLVRLTPS